MNIKITEQLMSGYIIKIQLNFQLKFNKFITRMDESEFHKEATEKHDLNVIYKGDDLRINLKVMQGSEPKWYKGQFNTQTLPSQLKNHLNTTENVFECLRDKQSYQVDHKTGDIKLRTSFSFKNKKIDKASVLKLKQSPVDEFQILKISINHLRKQIESLKQSSEKSQKVQNQIYDKQIRQVASKLVQYLREQMNEKFEHQQKKYNEHVKENEKKISRLVKQNQSLKQKQEKGNILMSNLQKKILKLQEISGDEEEKVKNEKKDIEQKLYLHGQKIQVLEQKMQALNTTTQHYKRQQIQSEEKEEQQELDTVPLMLPSRIKKKIEERECPFQMQTPFIKDFIVNHKKITFRGKNGHWRQLLSKNIIERSIPYQFQIKILKTRYKQIKIGVCDLNRQKLAQNSWNSGNAVCYYGWGKIHYGYAKNKQQGEGFSQKQIVTVQVNLSSGLIEWKVDGKNRASIQNQLLKDFKREFVPYVQMFYTGDSIQWI